MTSSVPPPSRPAAPQGDFLDMIREFFRLEAAGGIVLILASFAALVIANSPFAFWYHEILNKVTFTIGFESLTTGGHLALSKPLLLWINDGLMAVFFFLVGLEIKREMKEGELASRDRALLPLIAAVGGMLFPALIFLHFNFGTPTVHGWAIPSATDIAFTLGVLALLGSRVPLPLKILATAIAVIDDLGAILIIALFYSHDLYFPAFVLAGAAFCVLLAMNLKGVIRPAAYILVGFILWIAILKSGIHATLAGVVTALCIPIRSVQRPDYSPCRELEHALHPWIAFLILPLFGFANAGVSLAGVSWDILMDPVVVGIAAGLFIGKQLGLFLFIAGAVFLRLSPRPLGVSWTQIYGMSILCGIGFTMSLFIGGLAYEDAGMQVPVRVGVIVGSLISAVFGYLLLRFAPRPAGLNLR